MAPPPSPFTTAERELIRTQFMGRFGGLPSLADGIWLRTWHAGPQAKEPKIPRAVASLLERGLVEIGPGRYGPCARFTPAGLDALRIMARDRRALDPKQYAHIRQELGMDGGDEAEPEAAA